MGRGRAKGERGVKREKHRWGMGEGRWGKAQLLRMVNGFRHGGGGCLEV